MGREADTMKVAGKIIIVTGAGSGIGREVALEAIRRGAKVAAVDIRADTLAETATLAGRGERISTHVLDVTDRVAVQGLPAAVIERFGALDGIVHCAGIIQPFIRLKDLDDAEIERVFAVNWLGTLYLTRAVLPVLLERPEGHIVNISSMGGFLPVPGQTIYGATKAAVKLLTEGLHSECANTNVRVTVVFPGAVATNITENSGVVAPTGGMDAKKIAEMTSRTLSADKAARKILDGMEKDAFRVLVGSDARLMDLLYRLSPRRAAGFIAKQMKALLPN